MKHPPRDPDHAAVLADLDPNSTAYRSAFQRASSGKVKNMAAQPCVGFLQVLTRCSRRRM